MTWSLNEIEALSRKATRGAGYPWGLAEEAGRAARWTCAAGWPGALALADVLTRNDGAPVATLGPQALGEVWSASGGLLCPIVTGATLCDLAADWAAGRTVTTGPVAWPLLLVPYMVWAADRTGAPLTLHWQGCSITRAEGKTRLDDPGAALDCARTKTVQLSATAARHGTVLTRLYRAAPMPQAVAILDAFAQRTYAPETEASRLTGAGAGLSDND
ncbi:hypothetical protein FIU86_05040 [Roseovarius sp. THAF9]|uniref:DUF3726 domain-containing protein n=1 Tax=Roseovarius sp. THAF9 TaxID=2587847 RepID=UPI001269879B|nr:DUF3726 domain-containing protein [Roseovarius sp. THAF9]QFT92196.1 hypothetical protein FIU86_05040 [Roseovarius sp. THAF9]